MDTEHFKIIQIIIPDTDFIAQQYRKSKLNIYIQIFMFFKMNGIKRAMLMLQVVLKYPFKNTLKISFSCQKISINPFIKKKICF